MLQKDNPFLKLDFTDNKGAGGLYIPPEGEYFSQHIPLKRN